jgi:hypothetical protein
MYIETVPNRNSPPAILLRQGWREGKKTRKRTLANLSDWPPDQIESLRRVLRGETMVSPQDLLTTAHTSPHGHVEALLAMIRRLGLETVIASKRRRERDLIASVITSKPAMHDRVKTGHVRPSGTRFFYPAAGSVGKSVFVRQLLGPHFSRCPWWRRRSSMALTAAASPNNLPQSSTGRLEVTSVLARS